MVKGIEIPKEAAIAIIVFAFLFLVAALLCFFIPNLPEWVRYLGWLFVLITAVLLILGFTFFFWGEGDTGEGYSRRGVSHGDEFN